MAAPWLKHFGAGLNVQRFAVDVRQHGLAREQRGQNDDHLLSPRNEFPYEAARAEW